MSEQNGAGNVVSETNPDSECIGTDDCPCPSCVQKRSIASSGQGVLFDVPQEWDEHWQGMPEFRQDDCTSYHSIQVHFSTPEDMANFAWLVDQPINTRTRFIWYPEIEMGRYADKMYVDRPKEETK